MAGMGEVPGSQWGREIWLGKVQAQAFFTDVLGTSVPLLPLSYWEKVEDSNGVQPLATQESFILF